MPQTSMLKYFAEQGGDDHGGPLHWPGTADGFPFRGEQVPNLKQQELESLPLALDFKSRSFKLWDAQDKVAFDRVMDRIVNGWYMQHRRFDNYVPEHQEYIVRLEWVQIYGEDPGSKHPGSGFDGRTQTVTIASATPKAGLASEQPRSYLRRAGHVIGSPPGMGTPGTPY